MASDSEPQRAPLYNRGTAQPVQPAQGTRGPAPAGLADILERVLDKGIVIAGDIQINLLDIELLTIKIRLLVASVERAQEMGINWWENDPKLTSRAKELEDENEELRRRLERLEEVAGLPAPREGEEVEVRTRRREVVEEDGEKVAERDERHTEEVEETKETDAKGDRGGDG
ncbi:MAG: putative gas vesicle synthesis protein [Solirubrobacterales bacterium]|nr:putative gas vesicle synthesis protein [Solirubrobacterales bacterium]